ncbi:uncharacterized protein LOC120350651 [Nilaparvata lugens]|uniref:uncharacterized protein LOC120350651 n=1 Tax=Nilaparvata lugens TaxID=108931 RepID=UPI00193DFD36|nr:uncharacterized protein LOC120350651 [Nilaparvata lugens]XP_039281056.1 uncharacterized protein LOC120350651 [Nilaparvata lugens]
MLVNCLLLASIVGAVSPVQTGWRPIGNPAAPPPDLSHLAPSGPPSHSPVAYQAHIPEPSDGCTLYKAVLDQDSPSQYVQYKTPIPDMKEFTLCHWHKFYNHSQDQPLFAYSSSHGRPRDIYSWVSNSDRASFYMLSVMGHTLYRLNYPVRLNKWYHACQSWNGRTGEWQIWVNSERIGRGFYNLVVGKTIKGGGVAVSGQEASALSGPENFDYFKPRSGLLGEVTLLQLYKAALTAGKAYTNHKHHHAHHFHHDDKLGEDDLRILGVNPAAAAAMTNAFQQGADFPFLRNGQLAHSLPVQDLSAFRSKNPQFNPQINILNQSPFFSQTSDPSYSLQQMRLYKREQMKEKPETTAPRVTTRVVTRVVRKPQKLPAAIRFNDEGDDIDEVDQYFEKLPIKRETEEGRAFSAGLPEPVKVATNGEREKRSKDVKEEVVEDGKREKRSANGDEVVDGDLKAVDKRSADVEKDVVKEGEKNIGEREKRSGAEEKDKDEVMSTQETSNMKTKREETTDERNHKKRTALIAGMPFGVIPGADLSSLFSGEGYMLGQGGVRFDAVMQQHQQQPFLKEEEEQQMEPAEWEVRSIMAVCSGCSEDPFRKASIVSWRETPKKLFSGVLYIPAAPECQRF